MAFHKIDSDSVNSITNQLDFFSIPPTDVSISSAKVFEILTQNPVDTPPYQFKIHSSDNFIDLSKCYLFTEFRIRKEGANGQLVNLAATDDVAPIQLIGNTFINNLKIAINGKEVFNSNSLMAYKSYLSHEISFSPIAKFSHLEAAGYRYNGERDSLETGNGFKLRKEQYKQSKIVQCIAKIDSDLFCQPKLLISHCGIEISIQPNESKFVLIAPTNIAVPATATAAAISPIKYHFEVVNCKLYIKKLSPVDGLALDIARKLETRPASYAVRKTALKSIFISQGRYQMNASLFLDQIPRRITLGLVANKDFVGDYTRSPFNFQHFNVREISITANGRIYPQAPYDLDYKNDKYVRPFHDMNDNAGFTNTLEGNGIGYAQFKKTHCIYIFNLTNSLEDQGGVFDLIKSGATSVDIKFSEPVPDGGIVLIVLAEMDGLFMFDKNRTISTDITV
jgi:hypothetical protein